MAKRQGRCQCSRKWPPFPRAPNCVPKGSHSKTQNVCKIIGIQELQKRRIGTKNGIHGNAGKNNAHWVDAAAPGHKVDQDAGKKAPTKATSGTRESQRGKRSMTDVAAAAAPAETPMMPGSAKGFLITA